MKAITLKESEVLDSNLSMIVPLYPLSKEKFEILRKNSWDYQSIGGRFLAIFLAFAVKVFVTCLYCIYLAICSNDHKLVIEGISGIDYWTISITLFLWLLFSFVVPYFRKTERDKVIAECIEFYKKKKQ